MSKEKTENESPLLTKRDIQVALQLSASKVDQMLRDWEIPSFRIGRSVRVRREAFDAWLANLGA